MRKIFILFSSFLCLAMLVSCKIKDKITGGTDSLENSMEEVQNKMAKLANEKGYELSFKCSSDGDDFTYTIGETKNARWLKTEEEYGYAGYGAVLDGDKIHFYDVNEDGSFEYDYSFNKGENEYLFDQFAVGYNAWIYYGYSYDGMLTKLGSTKVCGRDAIEYEFNLGAGLGVIGSLAGLKDFKYKIFIDKEFGITLKLEASLKTTDESEKISYEVTKFTIGNVTIPSFPEPVEEGEDPFDNPTSQNKNEKYATELAINNLGELISVYHETFVAVYAGSETDLENSVFVDNLGQIGTFYVWRGFSEDGDLDRISGYCCIYYFFDSLEDYNAAVAMKTGKGLRGTNESCLYITVTAYNVDADNWDELVANFNNGDEYRYQDFVVVE